MQFVKMLKDSCVCVCDRYPELKEFIKGSKGGGTPAVDAYAGLTVHV